MPTKSNAQRLIDLFGGVREMSRATGLDQATISRFTSTGRRGCHGVVPVRLYDDIYDAAVKKGFPKQAKLYMKAKCPTCGHEVAAGEKK